MATEHRYARTEAWIGEHPDIVALRERFDVTAESPQSQFAGGLLMLTGLWAAISPWVVGFRGKDPDLTVSTLIIGLAVAMLAYSYGTVFGRSHRVAWTTPLLGAWLLVAQWVIQGTHLDAGTIASNVVTGSIVIALGLVATGLIRVAVGSAGSAPYRAPEPAPGTAAS
jgi:hypothetical protein